MLIVLAAGSFTITASAQDTLNALMNKCESMDDVNMDVIQQRNPSTKKLTQVIKSVSIKNNKALIDDFLKAFEADKNEAIQAIYSKKNGKMVPSYFQFKTGSKNVSYSFSMKNNGADASIDMIQNGE